MQYLRSGPGAHFVIFTDADQHIFRQRVPLSDHLFLPDPETHTQTQTNTTTLGQFLLKCLN